MKETVLSICEKNFILQAASESKRLDGRKLDEFRNLNVYFGTDWGLCYASLGETKVITQVSCEIQQPKTTRPNEGLLLINVELSPMAAPHIEAGRGSDLSNHLNRLLEKCIEDSKAVDLESLCLVSEEKVWVLRVDVNILNHDGNLIQCASVSALAALAHFKRPDVTTDGQDIVVHSISERDPIPITLYHYPVCITYALLNSGKDVLADPTALEERISDASLIFGINSFGEVCGLHLGGNALVSPELILNHSKKAAKKAREMVAIIHDSLKKDAEARQSKESFGLVECIPWDNAKSMSESHLKIRLSKFTLNNVGKKSDDGDEDDDIDKSFKMDENEPEPEIIDLGSNCAELIPVQGNSGEYKMHLETNNYIITKAGSKDNLIKKVDIVQSLEEDSLAMEDFGEGGPSKWEVNVGTENQAEEDSDSAKSDEEVHVISAPPKDVVSMDLSGDSEEEVVVLQSHDIDNPTTTSKSTTSGKPATLRQGKPKNAGNEGKKNKKKRRKLA